MAHINLLPWRERLREAQKREFLSILAGVVIIAGGLLLAADRYFNREIRLQTGRNEFMRAEIALLDRQVAEINQLRQQKAAIRARMSVITDLQGSRPVIVRIFDELVNTLPDGVFYETLERRGDNIAIRGVAESYSRITGLMRRLDDSEWFRDANLSDISAAQSDETVLPAAFTFSLNLALELPAQSEEV